jgi:sterol desaturase/sphingolipid hydroxylase (fatty acid hydroxylase superfamily)
MIAAVVVAVGLAMMVMERARPGVQQPRVRGFWWRAIAASVVQAGCVQVLAPVWDRYLLGHRPWSAATLGHAAGALLGYLVLTLVYYFWHRARHEVPWLWRWLHQLHHSPQRIEVITSFYKHPLEIVANGLLSSAVLYGLVGLTVPAAAGAVLLSGLAELFYHWNVRTPEWIGYLIQRPESHRLHHERGHHARNYSDVPLWDMLFGTFENARGAPAACGFDDGLETRVGEMLLGRDVNAEASS